MWLVRLARQAFGLSSFIRYWVVSGIGTPFSSATYWFLMSYTDTGMLWSSRISSMLAQCIDFYPHKRLTFREDRHDRVAFGIELGLYLFQMFVFMWKLEPYMLGVVSRNSEYGIMRTWILAHLVTGSLRFTLMWPIFRFFRRPETRVAISRIYAMRLVVLTIFKKD